MQQSNIATREGSTGPSRGKHWLAVYRAHTSFQGSGQKNEDISKSVSSIDSGAIFLPRLGQDLSRNVVVVSVYAF